MAADLAYGQYERDIIQDKPGGLDSLRGVWLALLIVRMVITPQLTTKESKIRTLDHTLSTIDAQNQRFEHTTMHYYTTIYPKSQIFEPTTMHYTTIDWPPNVKSQNSNPRPCTTPPRGKSVVVFTRLPHFCMHLMQLKGATAIGQSLVFITYYLNQIRVFFAVDFMSILLYLRIQDHRLSQ
jgi:hypothetical protein